MQEQIVVFTLAGESYGIDIGSVSTIIRMQEISDVPGSPKHIQGVTNLRGSIIPVVSLRKRLGFDSCEPTKASRIIVIEGNDMVGLAVDSVTETLKLPEEAVEPPPPANSEYIRGIGKLEDRLVILLDLEKVLSRSNKKAA